MYIIIRLIIGFIFFVCSIAVIKTSKTARKHILYAVFAGLSVILVTVLAFLPIENSFVTFDSPKAAYEYFNSGKSNIELVVKGDNCDFIIDRKKDSDTYLIVPKTANGWKIGIGWETKRIVQKFSGGVVVYVYQYKNTNDYFVTVSDINGEKLTISDEYNTEFYPLERTDNALGKTFVTYYAHITDLDSQYSVTVNGSKIVLKD